MDCGYLVAKYTSGNTAAYGAVADLGIKVGDVRKDGSSLDV